MWCQFTHCPLSNVIFLWVPWGEISCTPPTRWLLCKVEWKSVLSIPAHVEINMDSKIPDLFCLLSRTVKQLHGSDPTWGGENMKEKHLQLFQEQNPGLQDYLGSQCFHNHLPDLKVVLDCLGFGLFGINLGCLGWLGGAPPRFHSLWPFSSLQSGSCTVPTGWV